MKPFWPTEEFMVVFPICGGVIGGLIWGMVLLSVRRDMEYVRRNAPWPVGQYRIGPWMRGHYVTDAVAGPAGLLLLAWYCLWAPAWLVTPVVGTIIAPRAFWHFLHAPRYDSLIVSFGWGIVLSALAFWGFRTAHRWRAMRRRLEGWVEAWMLIPFRVRPKVIGYWYGRVRTADGSVITLVSEVSGPPPTVSPNAPSWRWCYRPPPSWTPFQVVTCDPPVHITWMGAPQETPFLLRWVPDGQGAAAAPSAALATGMWVAPPLTSKA